MTVARAAEMRFKGDLAKLKALKGWTDADLAEAIGCGTTTITRMNHSPGRVSAW